MSDSMVVGLDLGQSQDYSALAVVEHVRVLPAGSSIERAKKDEKRFGTPAAGVDELRVRHLQRWQLGTPYDAIVEDVGTLMRTDELRQSWLLFDATGVGRGIKDMLIAEYMAGRMGENWPVARSISHAGGANSVAKRDLMSVLQVALQRGRLKIAQDLPLRPVLEEELRSFRLKISATGVDTYEFRRREGSGHGDLTVAVALASSVGHGVQRRMEVASE